MKKVKSAPNAKKSETKPETKLKPSDKEIEAYFGKHEVFKKVNKIFEEAGLHELGVNLKGLQIGNIRAADAGYCCTLRAPKKVGGVMRNVCVAWSDGQDHSNDPFTPDCPM